MRNPCLTCGACCAYFRNSFYWAEAGDATPGGVPPELTERLTPFLRVMKGTNQPKPRCVALGGTIGESVACEVYELRPSPCRDFVPSWMDGVQNERCDAARAAHGMPPILPEFYLEPEIAAISVVAIPLGPVAPAALFESASCRVAATPATIVDADNQLNGPRPDTDPDDDPDTDPDSPPTSPTDSPQPPLPTAA
jgi:Fe-S-cluster containining protein